MAGQLRLMEQKTTLGFKLEANPYSVETLTAADYDFSAYNIRPAPEIETYMRKLARGDLSQDVAVAGRRKGTVSWSVDMHSGSAQATPPQYYQMLRACGHLQTTYGATGVTITPNGGYDRVPATIEVVYKQEGASPDQLLLRFRGAMGNAKLVCDGIGQPVRVDFEFQGVWDVTTTRAYASIVTPTGFDTALPDAVLSATINLFGTTQFLGGFTIDLGAQVELFSDASDPAGYHGARVVARDPKVEIDPDMLVTTDIDLWSNATLNTTGQLSISIGKNITFTADVAQIEGSPYTPQVREGHYANRLRLGLKRSTYGNDEYQLLQGATS